MEDTLALDGGSAATKWKRRHARRKLRAPKEKARRAALDAGEARYQARLDRGRIAQKMRAAQKNKEAKRKARVAKVEQLARQKILCRRARIATIDKQDRAAKRLARHKAGYVTPGLLYKDMTGQRFGLLVVLRIAGRCRAGRKWWVQCDCGSAIKEIRATNLRQGTIRSCGCWGQGELRDRWHKPHIQKQLVASAARRNRLLSRKLLDIRKLFKAGSEHAITLAAVRKEIIRMEKAGQILRPRGMIRRPRHVPRYRRLLKAA